MTAFRKAIQARMVAALNRALLIICAAVFVILVLHIAPQIAGGGSFLKWMFQP